MTQSSLSRISITCLRSFTCFFFNFSSFFCQFLKESCKTVPTNFAEPVCRYAKLVNCYNQFKEFWNLEVSLNIFGTPQSYLKLCRNNAKFTVELESTEVSLRMKAGLPRLRKKGCIRKGTSSLFKLSATLYTIRFNNQKFYILPTDYICVPCIIVFEHAAIYTQRARKSCFCCFQQNCEKRLLTSLRLSVHLSVCGSTWNNWVPTGRVS